MKHECKLPNRGLVDSLYKKYFHDLLQYFLSYTHQLMDAEDMVQNLFVKVMYLDVITLDTARSLLFLMARRMIIDDVRHKAFLAEYEKQWENSMDVMSRDSVARRVEVADILSFEKKHLAEMPKKRAHIYKMYKHEEKTAAEIAKQLHLSKRTVESQIYLSTKDMKAYLRKII